MFTVIIVVCSSQSMCILSFVLIGCCVSELHGHLCPYRNVWPEVVLQDLHCLPNYLHTYMIKVGGCYHITKFPSIHFQFLR